MEGALLRWNLHDSAQLFASDIHYLVCCIKCVLRGNTSLRTTPLDRSILWYKKCASFSFRYVRRYYYDWANDASWKLFIFRPYFSGYGRIVCEELITTLLMAVYLSLSICTTCIQWSVDAGLVSFVDFSMKLNGFAPFITAWITGELSRLEFSVRSCDKNRW